MSDTVYVALIAVIPTFLTTIAAMAVKFRQDSREYRRSLEADNTANSKLDHITVLTNSTLTAANKEIGDLKKQLADLLEVVKKQNGDEKKDS